MSELKQIRISSLKSLPLEYKAALQSPKWCTYKILNNSKQTKIEEAMGLKLERVLKLVFQTNWSKLSLIFFLCVFRVAPLLPMLKEHL
jgi:hypothetical protein